jgi:hypothetical protein
LIELLDSRINLPRRLNDAPEALLIHLKLLRLHDRGYLGCLIQTLILGFNLGNSLSQLEVVLSNLVYCVFGYFNFLNCQVQFIFKGLYLKGELSLLLLEAFQLSECNVLSIVTL